MSAARDLPAFPTILEVELTRRCNLACRMCQRQSMPAFAQDRDLNSSLLETILDQCDKFAPQINLGGLGESLLHKRLSALLAMIKQHNPAIRTGFNTNGVLLSESTHDWLLDGRLDYLTISLNAPDAEGFRWLVGADAYGKIVRQARQFLTKKGRGRPPLTTVHVFDIRFFAEGNQAFTEAWEDIADFVQVRRLGNWASTVDPSRFGAAPLPLRECERPWLSLAIDLTGAYHRCCATFAVERRTETIYTIPIHDYWLGPTMQAERAAMTARTFEQGSPCLNCSGRAIPPNSVLEQQAFSETASTKSARFQY